MVVEIECVMCGSSLENDIPSFCTPHEKITKEKLEAAVGKYWENEGYSKDCWHSQELTEFLAKELGL